MTETVQEKTAGATLIQGGLVYDGSGEAGRRVDIRVADGRITEIGPGLETRGETIVDATGLLVAPGLVDLHVHVLAELVCIRLTRLTRGCGRA